MTSRARRCCSVGCRTVAPGRFRRVGLICLGGGCPSERWAGWARRPVGDCSWSVGSGCGRGVRLEVEPPAETEVLVPGQLALVIEETTVVPAAVWETLPPERQLQVAVRLARLLARIVETARDE